jgi:hypothetical protein
LATKTPREAVASGDPALRALHDELAAYPTEDRSDDGHAAHADIAVPLRLRHDGVELAFVATQTAFGTATDVTVAELSIESLFPADAHTAEALRALARDEANDRSRERRPEGAA